MIYPDFSFYTSTQIILFFINCLVTFLSYYWGANLMLQIYQKNVSFKQKFLFSFFSAMLLNILIVYGLAYIIGLLEHRGRLSLGEFRNAVNAMLPFAYFVLYLLGIRILKLSNFKCVKIMHLSYVYYVCCNLVLRIAGIYLFPRIPDARGCNYLREILMLVSGTAIIYIFYATVRYIISRYKLDADFFNNIIVHHVRHELLKNFFLCCVLYALLTASYYQLPIDGIHAILIFALCCSYLIIYVMKDYTRVYKGRLANKDEHITALNQSIEQFRGIKHDFNNILQTYSGYLAIQDYENLQVYHQRMVNTTVSVGTRLDISQRMPENPSFFSLIVSKLEKAKQCNVNMQIALLCDMGEIYMDALDFARVMAVLLDNAIEAAEQAPSKRINLSGQLKPDGSKLLILSNDTVGEVTAESLFTQGFTTKAGHMGQGLVQVRNTLHQYGNSTFNITCYKGCFTVYLELKPTAAHAFTLTDQPTQAFGGGFPL